MHQLANLLYQLYLFPSLMAPGFAVRRGCSPAEASLTRSLHQLYVTELLKMGWIVEDRSGILHLPKAVSNRLDELAQSV
jgi:hypothetical protein